MPRRPHPKSFRPRLVTLETRDCPTVTLVSEGGPGDGPAMANGVSTTMAVSAHLHWIAFVSEATNLVSGQIDTPGTPDLFLHDGVSGSTRLISHVAGNALQAAGGATTARGSVSITHFGLYLAFSSTATNLVANQVDTAGTPDVFLFDRGTGSTTLLSRRAGTVATAGNGMSDSPSIGLEYDPVVAFRSLASDLQSGYADTNGKADIVLHLVTTNATTYITAGNGDSGKPLVDRATSFNGGDIAFESLATNLISGQVDTNGATDIFRYGAGTITLVTRQAGSTKTTADGGSTLHDNSNTLAFTSTATNLVAGQTGTPGQENAFGHSTQQTSQVYLFSRPNGSQTQTANGGTDRVVLNGDGLRVLFRSTATNIVAGQVDTNNGPDLFMVDWEGANTPNFSLLHSRSHISQTQTGNQPVSNHDFGAFGNSSYFTGLATDYVAGFADANGPFSDLYRGTSGQTAILVSHAVGSPTTSADTGVGERLAVSGSGGFLAYDSPSANLVTGIADTANSPDVFAYDPYDPGNVAVTRADVESPVMKESDLVTAMTGRVTSADGRYTAYVARTPSLPGGQFSPDDYSNVYLFDAVTRTTTLVSRLQSGSAGGHAGEPSISADGRYVAYVRADGNESQVFYFDRDTGLVQAFGFGDDVMSNSAPVISADGAYIVFRTHGARNNDTDTNGAFDIYLFDRLNFGPYTLVSRSAASATTTANGASAAYAISTDGAYVAFSSTATNVASGVSDTNAQSDVFLFSRATGTNTLVSRSAASSKATAAKGSYAPTISDNGRYVAFMSYANNIVVGQSDAANSADAFVFDRLNAAGTKLVSRTAASGTTAAGGINPKISGDGSAIVFRSAGTNLVTGQTDTNSNYDVFVYNRVTGVNAMVSRAAGSTATAANGVTFGDPTISANGQRIAYQTTGTNLVASSIDTNGQLDVFVFDRGTGLNTIASHLGTFAITGNGESKSATISADGSTVVFTSLATNFAPSDANGFRDVFAFRSASGGAMKLAGAAFGGPYVGTNESVVGPAPRADVRPPARAVPRESAPPQPARASAGPDSIDVRGRRGLYASSGPSPFPSPPLKTRPLLAGS